MMSHTTWTTLQFVKDKNNLLNFNQWSAGKYLNNTTGFIGGNGTQFSIENDSLKVTYNNKGTYITCYINYDNPHIGNTLKASAKVFSQNYGVNFQLYLDEVWKTLVSSEVLNEWYLMELSYHLEDETLINLRWSPMGGQTDSILFLKDFNLNIQ